MRIKNVSSICKMKGSDIDLNLWLHEPWWGIAVNTLTRMGVATRERRLAYKVMVGRIEMFILPIGSTDIVAFSLEENARIQRLWTRAEKERYCLEKKRIEHLTGRQRKGAKAELALRFGLTTIMYER